MSAAAPSDVGSGLLILTWIARGLGTLVVLGSVLPFVRSGWWVVRTWDFPRLQLALVSLLPIALFLIILWRGGWRLDVGISLVLLIAAFIWQAAHVMRYTPLRPTTVPGASTSQLRLLVANLDFENDQHAAAREAIEAIAPDVLLLIEIDDTWSEALAALRESYPHQLEAVRDMGLGIAVWSRFELIDPRVDYRVSERRASLRADLELEDRRVHFVGVHPTPPALERRGAEGRHDSRIRDAELVLIARDVADATDDSWVVAGDFNDVAWSHTTRLFQRVSGLKDPRVGRGMYSTYHAEYPLLRYPLDHVFVSDDARIANLERVRIPGSDHFAMLADLDFTSIERGVEPEADAEDHEEAADLVEEGTDDADDLGRAAR